MKSLLYALLGAFVSLLCLAIWEGLAKVRSRRKLHQADETQFKNVLASDSLADLGRYLDTAVGQFSLAEYAHDSSVRDRVNLFLARLQEFVGKTEDIQSPQRPSLERTESAVDPEADGIDLRAVEEKLDSRGVWDALAHLRRIVEGHLRPLALQCGVQVPERASATRLLAILRRSGAVTEDTWSRLRYVIEVSNRAVHGLDVSTAEAIEVISHARRALAALRKDARHDVAEIAR